MLQRNDRGGDAGTLEILLRALGMLQAWSDGYVEPVTPPVMPLHLEAPEVIEGSVFSYYVGQSLALLADPATRAEGIRFVRDCTLRLLADGGMERFLDKDVSSLLP